MSGAYSQGEQSGLTARLSTSQSVVLTRKPLQAFLGSPHTAKPVEATANPVTCLRPASLKRHSIDTTSSEGPNQFNLSDFPLCKEGFPRSQAIRIDPPNISLRSRDNPKGSSIL